MAHTGFFFTMSRDLIFRIFKVRIIFIGLFSSLESDNIVQNVTKSAKITHTHPDAINGAVLQAASVMWALESIHPKDISKKLIELSMKIEKTTTDDETTSGYTEKMTNIEKYLNNQMFDHDKLIGEEILEIRKTNF